MATSFIKKSMAYLGLVDDYDDYDDYDRPAPLATRQRPVAAEPEDEAPAASTGRIRVTPAGTSSGTVAAPAQQPAARPATSPSVKISTPDAGAREGYRRLKVTVKQKGYVVQSREGYYPR